MLITEAAAAKLAEENATAPASAKSGSEIEPPKPDETAPDAQTKEQTEPQEPEEEDESTMEFTEVQKAIKDYLGLCFFIYIWSFYQ